MSATYVLLLALACTGKAAATAQELYDVCHGWYVRGAWGDVQPGMGLGSANSGTGGKSSQKQPPSQDKLQSKHRGVTVKHPLQADSSCRQPSLGVGYLRDWPGWCHIELFGGDSAAEAIDAIIAACDAGRPFVWVSNNDDDDDDSDMEPGSTRWMAVHKASGTAVLSMWG